VYLYTSYISDAAVLNKEYDRYLQTAIHLFELIFQNTSLPKGRIIVSPDGKYFPFEALVTNKNYSFPVYFLNDYIVSYTYSARFLLNDFKINVNSSTGNFLGVAPVQYPATFHLSSLPLSDVSLEKMSAYFKKANNITSSLATKNNFLNQFPGYKIIQLYTHASDSSSNGEPVIYFADSALYLSELIPEKKTATQLIVLSACETGNGKLYKGEGVFSFNRGFASLGIPSSVINLWAVDNESTYKLTELFYKYVSQGIPLDISLQKAKLEFISTSSKNKRMPYYWAAAIIAGKTDSVNIGKSVPWLVIIIAGILVTSLVLFLSFYKPR
jgi:CHAT domain-containing protein